MDIKTMIYFKKASPVIQTEYKSFDSYTKYILLY